MRKHIQYVAIAMAICLALVGAALPAAPLRAAPRADTPVYLPLIETQPGPPEFKIISPMQGLTLSGTSIFAVQPVEDNSIVRVRFEAGSVVLGTDDTPADGFQVFLDTSQLPAGSVELSATATGPTGQTVTKSIMVTVNPTPPSSAAVDETGATLATASGNTIVVPPGAVEQATTVTVEDKTQEEVTAEAGIDWDGLGVTFLGAIDVQTDGPIAKPLGVSSVGFGNRIQPGQAVVTYRILPDADGDGVGELVVVNGAGVAPNGTIVSSAVGDIVVTNIVARDHTGAVRNAAAEITGPPGTIITIDGNGFNPLSAQGNRVRFRSQVDGEIIELPGTVDPNAGNGSTQRLTTLIPMLAPGPATLELINQSTGGTAGPFELTVEPAQALSKPAPAIIDETLALTINALQQLQGVTNQNFGFGDIAAAISVMTEVRSQFQEIAANPTPADEQLLAATAAMLETSGVQSLLSRNISPQVSSIDACDLGALKDIATGLALAGATLLAVYSAPVSVPLLIVYGGGFLGGIGSGVFIGAGVIECLTPPPPPCGPAPAASGGGTTGMGAAPPPGGNGCGNVGGGGGGLQSASRSQIENGRYTVRIFPQTGAGGALTPFTGATDPGGYFFIPLIPQGEPFKAVALDNLTGASTTFEGVGPPTGQSVYMTFDFFGEQGNRYDIQIGDTITNGVPGPGAGNIEEAGGLDIYTFSATAGQQVFFDLFGVADTLAQVRWQLVAPNGDVLFNRIFNCCGGSDPGVYTLVQGGVYTLRVGGGAEPGTGVYGFKLWDVPPADEFAIAVGDTISNGVPGPGAGNIESPGVKDIYTFEGAAGQQVFFDLFGVVSALVQVQWRLQAPDGTEIFDHIFNCCGGNDVGVVTLEQNGVYTLTAGDDQDAGTGVYGFTLWNVPPPSEYSIAVGDTITNGVPAPGAGVIESPGVKDIYTFNATAGQQVYFDAFGVAQALAQVNWRLEGPNGDVLFDRILNCCGGADAGVMTLAEGGAYRLIVGDDEDAGTGVYGFTLSNVPPPDEFAIAVGDTITNGVPAPGAGNIETPGAKDIYTFNATAGEGVFLDLFGVAPALVQVNWRLVAPDGEVIFDRILNCCGGSDPGEFTLGQTGEYTIIIGDDADAGVGTYGFEIRTP